MSGHLPAPIVNGGGDRLGKVQFSELQKPRDLDLGSSHTAYRRASVINRYQISMKSDKLFCGWTNCRDPSKFKVTQKLGQISKIRPDQI